MDDSQHARTIWDKRQINRETDETIQKADVEGVDQLDDWKAAKMMKAYRALEEGVWNNRVIRTHRTHEKEAKPCKAIEQEESRRRNSKMLETGRNCQ